MRREVLLSLALVLLVGFGFAGTVSISYGDRVSKSFELSDSMALGVTVSDVPAHVHQIYVDLSSDLDGHVYCAPGLRTEEDNTTWDADFTCILLPGAYEGDIYFRAQDIDVDANGVSLATAKTTRLSLSVVEKEVWYTNYGYTNIGGSITVGSYKVEVSDADVVSADVTVYKGSAPIWSGVVFIGQEVSPADDIRFTFNGYSEKRGQAFFTFKTRFPAAVSSSVEEYYIAVPNVVYADDTNKARVDIKTNCDTVSICDSNDDCSDHSVPDSGVVSIVLSPGDYTVTCKGTDKKEKVSVLSPVVITKTVEKKIEPNPNEVCPSWFYGLSPAAKTTYCSSVCSVQRPSSATSLPSAPEGARWIGLLIVAAVLGYFLWKKYREGGFGGGSRAFEETEKEIEAVPDIEG